MLLVTHNFSMFQDGATKLSWTFLTEVLNLPKDRLYVTYFGGDEKQGLEPDLEAKNIWLERGVAEDHLLPGDVKDNFWGKYLMGFNYIEEGYR